MLCHHLGGWGREGGREGKENKGEEKRRKEKQISYTNTYIWNLRKENASEEPRGRTEIKTQT